MYEANPDAKYPSDWSSTDQPGDRAGYISLEKSEVYVKTAQGAFDLAGLGKVVKVGSSPFGIYCRHPGRSWQFVIGSSTPNLRSLREKLDMPKPLQFDMIFLDHLKPLYTVDIKVMEEEGLIGPVRTGPASPSYLVPSAPDPSLTNRAPSSSLTMS
jgi:catechol O-methyltransferase